jgi:hypothetical protein
MIHRASLLLACLLSGLAVTAQAQETARVQVYAEHQGGNVIYRYEIRNTGPGEIRRIQIGCDCRGGPVGVLPQLRVLPLQAEADRTDDFGTWFKLPPEATNQPPGWRARLLQPRGASGYWIEWYMPAARANAGISAGQTLTGFSITLPGADETYLSAHYTIHPGDSKVGPTSGPLALLDTTPPTLSLEVTTAGADAGNTAAVRVLATVKDDRDPQPRVVVEAMGRTEAQEPGYAVTYSATDASGNRATATTRVRLPAETETKPADRPNPQQPVTNLPRLAFLP